MDILNKPIETFSFSDIVAFCKINQREDVQLDYKVDLADGGLAKHFAAFSNTRGGVIIIGVEEDKKTGLPIKYDGIETNAQNIETIYQWSNNVEPLPKIKIHPTDEVGGKRFILVRIYEGDDTPYHLQNDGRIWIRTGNISKDLIEIASPDYSKLLYRKNDEAKENRIYFTERADNILQSFQRNALISEQGNPSVNEFRIANTFASAKNVLNIELQPNYPNDQLTKPSDLVDRIREYICRDHDFDEFPSTNLGAVPEGAAFFDCDIEQNTFSCHEVFSQGLIFYKSALGNTTRKGNGILLQYILGKILVFLKASANYYRLFEYQGTLKGAIRLSNAAGKILFPGDDSFEHLSHPVLLNYYFWELSLDTRVLLDDLSMMEYYFSIAGRMYWDLGFRDFNQTSLEQYLKSTKLIK